MTLPEDASQHDRDPAAAAPAEPAHRGHALAIDVVIDGDRTTATLTGELDLSEAEAAAACLQSLLGSGLATLVLDLTGLAFLDSRGISVLVQTWMAVRDQGGRMPIKPSRTVMTPLSVAGLDKVFEFDT